MEDNLSLQCVVCREPSGALCASGQPFCTRHAACAQCHVVLSNGELQKSLVHLGSENEQDARMVLRLLKNNDPRANKLLVAALDRAVNLLRAGAELTHEENNPFCSPAKDHFSVPRGGDSANADSFLAVPA